MKTETVSKLEKSFSEKIQNVYNNGLRFHWQADLMNKAIATIYSDPLFQQMPRYAQSFVYGVRYHCDLLHWKQLVFSYVVHNKRLSIRSDEYRAIDPAYVSKFCSHTGSFAYVDDIEKTY